MIGRRGFITGLVAFVAAPAIVRAGSLMPVRVMEPGLSAVEIINRALLHMAERQVNPPLMDLFNMDAVIADMVRIHRVPAHWLTER